MNKIANNTAKDILNKLFKTSLKLEKDRSFEDVRRVLFKLSVFKVFDIYLLTLII